MIIRLQIFIQRASDPLLKKLITNKLNTVFFKVPDLENNFPDSQPVHFQTRRARDFISKLVFFPICFDGL